MKKNKLWSIITVLVFSAIFTFSSCSKNSSLPPYVLGGCWIAETDSWYYYITFYDNHTFDYTSESKRGSEGTAKGTYTYDSSNNIISCSGYVATVYMDGDVTSGDWKADFQYDEGSKLLTKLSSDIIFSRDKAYDNKDHSRDMYCDMCGGTGVCRACDGGGVCYFCHGAGGEYDRYLGRWVDCRHCDNGFCSDCNGTGRCPECNGTGMK